ncbi:MAG: chemotaxis protein CheD [Candidatus Kariarchaeaceae archaeon]|jgi:chemotaxis protein CheD
MADYNAGIGKIVYGKSPDTLSATALGSCVGAIIFDPTNKIAGLAHIALPSLEEAERRGKEKVKEFPGRYADIAIPSCIKRLKKLGAQQFDAKIVGGSKIFNLQPNLGHKLHLGKRTTEAVKLLLKAHSIPILAEDTDGDWSRTIVFFMETSELKIRRTTVGLNKYNYNTKELIL